MSTLKIGANLSAMYVENITLKKKTVEKSGDIFYVLGFESEFGLPLRIAIFPDPLTPAESLLYQLNIIINSPPESI